ncbi:MAG TPA: hypothetical protein VMT44_00190 [Methanoregula sp.]|nr:hypothetical protein [Methanoregula sp.]
MICAYSSLVLVSRAAGFPRAGSGDLFIGAAGGIPGFVGSVDEVQVYDTGLSAADVDSLYAAYNWLS